MNGDCTVLAHPSGRMTMIDINNSQDYDPDSLQDLVEEERRKAGVVGFSPAAQGLGFGGFGLGGLARISHTKKAHRGAGSAKVVLP
jgi:hypothetical protein